MFWDLMKAFLSVQGCQINYQFNVFFSGFDRDGDAMVECNNRRAVLKLEVLSTIPDDEAIPEKGDNARLLSSEGEIFVYSKAGANLGLI